jgi:hypothetical protein
MGFPEADRWRCSSRPLIFGIGTSAIRQEVRRTWRELKNSSADANTWTLNPNDFMRPPLLALDLLHPGLWGNDALRSEASGVLLSTTFKEG